MRPEHMPQARDAGAQGLAMMRGIWEANHVEDVVKALL
jgi:thiamine monophosphate synthase